MLLTTPTLASLTLAVAGFATQLNDVLRDLGTALGARGEPEPNVSAIGACRNRSVDGRLAIEYGLPTLSQWEESHRLELNDPRGLTVIHLCQVDVARLDSRHAKCFGRRLRDDRLFRRYRIFPRP